jgi:hypothetical protein
MPLRGTTEDENKRSHGKAVIEWSCDSGKERSGFSGVPNPHRRRTGAAWRTTECC